MTIHREFAMTRSPLLASAAVMSLVSLVFVPALAQRSPPPPQTAVFDPATLPDQEIGRRITIKAEDLPPPKTGPIVASRSMVVPYQDQRPRVPDGFTATPFATGLEHPRRLLVLPNGDVIV